MIFKNVTDAGIAKISAFFAKLSGDLMEKTFIDSAVGGLFDKDKDVQQENREKLENNFFNNQK